MGARILLGILLVVLLVAGVAGITRTAYNAGLARGLADSGQVSPPPGVAPYPGPWP